MISRSTRLPAKRKRPKMGIIQRGPQRMWMRHRKFVKSRVCCVSGCTSIGVPDPAHLRGVNNAGWGLKPPDWYLVPLCRHHHLEQEPIGPDAFGDRHGINLWEIAEGLARISPDRKMWVAKLEWELLEPNQFPALGWQDKTAECPGADHAQITPSAGGEDDPARFLPPATGISPANDDTPIGFTWFAVTPGSVPEKMTILRKVS